MAVLDSNKICRDMYILCFFVSGNPRPESPTGLMRCFSFDRPDEIEATNSVVFSLHISKVLPGQIGTTKLFGNTRLFGPFTDEMIDKYSLFASEQVLQQLYRVNGLVWR
jgi:hypothetical protein